MKKSELRELIREEITRKNSLNEIAMEAVSIAAMACGMLAGGMAWVALKHDMPNVYAAYDQLVTLIKDHTPHGKIVKSIAERLKSDPELKDMFDHPNKYWGKWTDILKRKLKPSELKYITDVLNDPILKGRGIART